MTRGRFAIGKRKDHRGSISTKRNTLSTPWVRSEEKSSNPPSGMLAMSFRVLKNIAYQDLGVEKLERLVCRHKLRLQVTVQCSVRIARQ